MNPEFFSNQFSSYDYYKNPQFQRLYRNWNKYLTYDGQDVSNMELMFQWEELLLKDFLKHSREWLNDNNGEWRVGLE